MQRLLWVSVSRSSNYFVCIWGESAMLMFSLFVCLLIKTHLHICGLSLKVTWNRNGICKGKAVNTNLQVGRALRHLYAVFWLKMKTKTGNKRSQPNKQENIQGVDIYTLICTSMKPSHESILKMYKMYKLAYKKWNFKVSFQACFSLVNI